MRKGRSLEGIAPAGQRVLAHARRIVDEAGNIRSYAANERGEHAGQLALATTPTQARYVLPAVIAAIKREYTRANVDLQAHANDQVMPRTSSSQAVSVRIATTAAPTNPPHQAPQ